MTNFKTIAAVLLVLTIGFAASTLYFLANPNNSTTTITTTATATASSGQLSAQLAFKPGVGLYLVNSTGFTLYFRVTDPGNGTSTCTTATCIKNWPAFYAGSSVYVPAGLSASSFGTITRAGIGKQTTFNGYPLYYWIGDTSPGQTTGQGIGNFYVCCNSPPAIMSTTTTSSSTTTSTSSMAPSVFPISIASGSSTNQSSQGYTPSTVTLVIGVNNTVIWTNDDSATHTVTSTSVPSGALSFNSGNLVSGATFTYTFTVPGTYQYHCYYHAWITGTVIVK